MLLQLLTFWPRFGNVPWVALPLGVIVLATLDLNVAVYQQRYQLTDRLGQETSFPTIGGHVEIFCDDEKGKKSRLINVTAGTQVKPVFMKQTKFELQNGLVNTEYSCEYVNKGNFMIGPLHCNPFRLKPAMNCVENEFCMIEKNGEAKCRKKNESLCYLAHPFSMTNYFDTSFPSLRTVCIDSKNETTRGLCHARSIGKPSIVLSMEAGCKYMKQLKFNSVPMSQDIILLQSFANKTWKIEYSGNSGLVCWLKNDENKLFSNVSFKNAKTISPNVEQTALPVKLQFTCKVYNNPIDPQFISVFIVVFDPDLSKYDVLISKKLKAEKMELKCSCNVPEGFVCGLTWEEPKISDDLQDKPVDPGEKTLLRKYHAKPIVYTCYMRVLAYDYPRTFKLKPVPLGIPYKAANVTVDAKDFDEGSDSDSDSQGNNGAGKDKTGNGKDGKEKNSNENKSNEDSSSNDTAKTAVAISVTLVVLLALAAIVGIVVVVVRRRKLARQVEEDEIKRKESAQRHAKDLSFINSIKDSPNKVDAAFVGSFYRIRDDLSSEICDSGKQLCTYCKSLPDFKIITTFWDSFNAYVPGELKKLSTTRYVNPVLVATWLYKDRVASPTTKTKTSENPEVLHVSIVTDIFMVPRYLASQAPLIEEMKQFLSTLIDENVTLVVCLLAEHEARDTPEDRGKYHDYLSLDAGKSMTYGESTLSCITIFPTAHFVTRVVEIKRGENTHKIHMIRYLSWPDQGVGPPKHLVELCIAIANLEKELPGKTLVHCSAGLGRTGCLLASLQCIQLYDFQGLPFDISAICLKVRKERHHAIQQFTQYAMVFWVVAVYIQRNLKQLAPVDQTLRQLTIRQDPPIARPKVAKNAKSPVAKDKQRSSASSAPKVTPSKQTRASKSTK